MPFKNEKVKKRSSSREEIRFHLLLLSIILQILAFMAEGTINGHY